MCEKKGVRNRVKKEILMKSDNKKSKKKERKSRLVSIKKEKDACSSTNEFFSFI